MPKLARVAVVLVVVVLAALATVTYDPLDGGTTEKPVIYLYPTETTEVTVSLDVDGTLTTIDPPFDSPNTWTVRAQPSGKLTDLSSGESYPYLFWEADVDWDIDMSTGSVVEGEETRAFLDKMLSRLGLSDSESSEFVDYWAARMEANAYNLVHFEDRIHKERAVLAISPQPDTVIRVLMVWRPLESPVSVEPQHYPPTPVREGFVVVEWGGIELGGE